MAWTGAACARKVETAVRQVPGVSQVQVLFATEKLLVNAEGDVRAQVENAVRQAGYTLRDCRCSRSRANPEGRCCATICRY
ncbi:Lead, cadmium, zinc and mercury transporting ATPase [Klebsiella pneumoniae]|uniref:Lead, cadmium, zinc and mercury transporting ATPase n=1 Tax=Klebsiella pneumoniae TaxID=573 RepID=A0A2X3CWK2_KLEPN|nr:Lead, cadmium, zinc and mercury transporting ATPase [Klebsiella pneumoniae]